MLKLTLFIQLVPTSSFALYESPARGVSILNRVDLPILFLFAFVKLQIKLDLR